MKVKKYVNHILNIKAKKQKQISGMQAEEGLSIVQNL